MVSSSTVDLLVPGLGGRRTEAAACPRDKVKRIRFRSGRGTVTRIDARATCPPS